ncbi:MAG: asparaginase [bacterium]|nr:asparaginase [bacterium]
MPERDKKSVYIAYTGGTIGMRHGRQGYEPAPGFLERQMEKLPVLWSEDMPHYRIHEYDPLLDSSNMSPADWVKLGRDIMSRYHSYDGFIVLHGTDTMAFSASALSFMFRNLGKPIVFTGSQIPLCEVRNDARENLIASLLIAAGHSIPEVCLFVGHQLLRGNRATKVSANRFLAFSSPNYPPLGEAGVDLRIHGDRLLSLPEAPVAFDEVGHAQVADLRIFPGITPETLEGFLRPPLQGAVLHTYGVGNAPDRPDLLEVMRAASDRGVVLLNCTQCLEGSVRMADYVTGNALRDVGVVSGYDLTPEAALTKLYFLLSLGLDPEVVRARIQEDLRGELTHPDDATRSGIISLP